MSTMSSAAPTNAQEEGAGLAAAVISLWERIDALTRRFAASRERSTEAVGEWAQDLLLASRGLAQDCRAMAADAAKAMDAEADAERARAAQLEAYEALLCKGDNDEEAVAAACVARALLCTEAAVPPCAARLVCDGVGLWGAVEECLRLRAGVDPSLSSFSGPGTLRFFAGDSDAAAANNVITVCGVDDAGEAVASLEAGDVHATLHGAGVVATSAQGPGVVSVYYHVPPDRYDAISVCVSVCGAPLAHCPCSVGFSLDSAVVAAAPAHTRTAFLEVLTSSWLPGCCYSLLYRGSHDGMSAAAFHAKCDGQGPTLTLVQAENGFSFGGYAGVSWESPAPPRTRPSPRVFLCSVHNPFAPPTLLPVKAACKNTALYMHPERGPYFSGGFYLKGQGHRVAESAVTAQSPFTDSFCNLGAGFEDVLGKGNASLTGASRFTPQEVEVFRVQGPEP